jgi:hypothetical protein
MPSAQIAAPTLSALDEDLRAAWVPDLARDFDAERLAACQPNYEVHAAPFEWMTVPKPDGTVMRVPLLPVDWLAELHRVVAPFKPGADALLSPGVCGYRRGAEPGSKYSGEHRRFSEFVEGEAASFAFVVTADVKQFFASTSWRVVTRVLTEALPSDDVSGLSTFAAAVDARGLHSLPPGYADARFLANLVLQAADEAIDRPFARWVDDYRIFCSTEADAHAALQRLESALDGVGLALNRAKVRVEGSADYLANCSQNFTSVYHPQSEHPDVVRTELRSLFLASAAEPQKHRRGLRFVLPRLAAERDDIAVNWALTILRDLPWETPRLAAYLSGFCDRVVVRDGVEEHLRHFMYAGDDWVTARLLALACSTGLSASGAEDIEAHVAATKSPTVWGLGLRALVLAGREEFVAGEVHRRVLDPRAASVVSHDLRPEARLTTDWALPTTPSERIPWPSLETIL